MKLDEIIAIVTEAVLTKGGTQEMAAQAAKDLTKAAEEEKADRAESNGPKAKSQLVAIIHNPGGQMKVAPMLGWIVQMPADDAPQLALDRAKAAGKAFNESKKGRKKPVKTVEEIFSFVPRKFWKNGSDTKTIPKTKQRILFDVSDDQLT